jgi:hypothetical protein
VIKSSNHTLSTHSLTSNFSWTTNFLWLSYRQLTPLYKRNTDHTAQKTYVTCQSACSLVSFQHWAWRGPHWKHLFFCQNECLLALWPSIGHGAYYIKNTPSNNFSIVACSYFGLFLEMVLWVTVSFSKWHRKIEIYLWRMERSIFTTIFGSAERQDRCKWSSLSLQSL